MATKKARLPLNRTASERREHPRFRLTLKGHGVYLTIPVRWSKRDGKFEAVTSDVSLGGLKAHFNEPVKIGDSIRMTFPLASGKELHLDVVVRWARHVKSPLGSVEAGVAFVRDVSRRDLDALLTVSDRRHEGAESPLSVVTRQVNLPLRRAIEISVRSLRIRFWRSLVTSAVILLAIGFLVYMLSVDQVAAKLVVGENLQREGRDQRIWVAIVSMLVAAVGITNTLHMTVAERYREIGTMKCLGALNRFVVELFLIESLALGVVGSLAGALVGTILATVPWMLRAKELVDVGLPWHALGTNLLIGTGVGMLLTIIGALYPSLRAAQMAPAEAMRTEV
jgi:hypothetical protein